VFNVALPITASANNPAGSFPAGSIANNASAKPCYGNIAASGTTIVLKMQGDTAGALINTIVNVTGADQNNTTRGIFLKFSYEV
jgi:hypothetical protein